MDEKETKATTEPAPASTEGQIDLPATFANLLKELAPGDAGRRKFKEVERDVEGAIRLAASVLGSEDGARAAADAFVESLWGKKEKK